MQRVVKPRTQRVKRALEERAPKLVENTKAALFLRGKTTSDVATRAMKDLYTLKKPYGTLFQKKNDIRPFEDASSLEFFGEKNDVSLFVFVSHNKKRPHNLVIGRLYNHHILDMVELGIEGYRSIQDFKSKGCALGSKPCMIFTGDLFETDMEYVRLKNIYIDFFRGQELSKVDLAGLDHIMCFTAVERKIYLCCYRILLKKSGSDVPRVELEEMGPSLVFVMRRTHLAPDQLYKKARRKPKTVKVKKVKNVSLDPFGSKLGRVHMKRQDFEKLQTRKMKGLKKRPRNIHEEDSPGTKRKRARVDSSG